MRIAILGDFHFGYDRFYDDSFVQAEAALSKAQEEADLILIAGDIFDARVPKQEVIARALELFTKLHKKVIAIPGTHERRPHGFVNPVDILVKAEVVENCHARPVIFEKDGERVAVYGLAGVPEEYAKVALERLAPKPVEGAFNIFMFHQNLKEVMPVVEHGLTMDDLPAGFDLYIDGHIHSKCELEKGGKKLLIPGSTVITQVRKEEKVKGFYVYDTKQRVQTYIAIQTRPFISISLKLNPGASLKEQVAAQLSSLDFSKKPIVRFDIDANGTSLDQAEINNLKASYSELCHLFINVDGEEREEAFANLEEVAMTNVSIRERGLLILKKVAQNRNLKIEDVEEAFEMACDAEGRELSDYFIKIASKR